MPTCFPHQLNKLGADTTFACIIIYMEQSIQKRYEAALNYIKNLPPTGGTNRIDVEIQLDNETRLQFYALFKQITEG